MTHLDPWRSPAGRPIVLRRELHAIPAWVARRRRLYRLIDRLADHAKGAVRRWLVPRPAGAPRQHAASTARRDDRDQRWRSSASV
jgi:hypothetical protein